MLSMILEISAFTVVSAFLLSIPVSLVVLMLRQKPIAIDQ
jgi:hypothetical protein